MIYVASSWRNTYQPGVVNDLRKAGFEVYDFRNPRLDDHGFHWSEIDRDWQNWSVRKYVEALRHPIAETGFSLDMAALRAATACVLVLPCGRSAHLEAGYCVGRKPVLIYCPERIEPELMYKMADGVYGDMDGVTRRLREVLNGK